MSRPRHTIHAAELLHAQAGQIAGACRDAGEGDAVLAAVDRFLSFRGVRVVQRSELMARVEELDAGGWVLIFSPGTELRAIEERCLEMGRLAFQRWEALQRWRSKHRVLDDGPA